MYKLLIVICLMLFCFIAHAERPIKDFDGINRFLDTYTTEVPNPDSMEKFDFNSIIKKTNIKKGLHPFFVIGYFSDGNLLKKKFTKEDIIQIIKKSVSFKDEGKLSHFYTPVYTDNMSRGNGEWPHSCFFSFFYDYKKTDIKVHPSFFIGVLESARCHIKTDQVKKLYDLYFEYIKDHPWRSEFIQGSNNTYIDVGFMKTSSHFNIDRNRYHYSSVKLNTFLRNLLDKRISIPEKIAIIKFIRIHNCLRQRYAPGYRADISLDIPKLDKTDQLAIEKNLKKSIEGYLTCRKKNQ